MGQQKGVSVESVMGRCRLHMVFSRLCFAGGGLYEVEALVVKKKVIFKNSSRSFLVKRSSGKSF